MIRLTTNDPVEHIDMNNEPPKKRHAAVRFTGGLIRLSIVAGLLALFVAVGFLVGGFLKFTDTIASYKVGQQPEKAAGITVYTGDSKRIKTASRLLRDGKGQRLLISGVNPKTSKKFLFEHSGLEAEQFACCVDIDRRAGDTRENAAETAIWAKEHKFDSVIVVTSIYHMPRSLLETSQKLPGVKIIPFPVASNKVDMKKWYRDRRTIRNLLAEYSKYVAVQARPVLAHRTVSTIRASILGNQGRERGNGDG